MVIFLVFFWKRVWVRIEKGGRLDERVVLRRFNVFIFVIYYFFYF